MKTLTSEYIISDLDHKLYNTSKEANNLYNAALYQVRQQFIKKHNLVNYGWLYKCFKQKDLNKENTLYHKLGYTQTAQQTLKEVNIIWYAWLRELKLYKANPARFTGYPRMPRYLQKGHQHIFTVTNQCAKIKNGYLIIKKLDLKIKLADNLGKFKQVKFKPLTNHKFKMLVQYEVPEVELKKDNGIYIGIDPGLDNAFTCVTNANVKPLIINGKGAKSVNQFYNKKIAEMSKKHTEYNQCCKTVYSKKQKKNIKIYSYSKSQYKLTDWRNAKIKQFAHKASKCIIDYALNCGANTIIIGRNKDQKRNANMGKRNNQNFIGIPHKFIIDMIKYKAELKGINVIETKESYTSQTSFLDGEKPCPQNGNYYRKLKGLSPVNRRVKRGLFKTNKGILINADVNGALQIIRKVFPKFKLDDGTERLVLSPIKYNVKF